MISISTSVFFELGVREFEGADHVFWLREIASYEKCPEGVNLR
jgi:hypothetical protein